MKKIFFSAALASFMFASCQNEEFVGSQESQMEEFTIEVTRGTDSRVYMDGSVAKWSADDALYVYGTNGVRGTLYLTSGANSKTATFTGVISGSSKNLTNAIFGNVTHNGDDISLTLNSVDAAECDAPMFGAFSADKGSISLNYICGLVPITISGDVTDEEISLGGVGVSTLSLVDGKWVPGAAYADITIDNVLDGQTFYVPFFTTTEENAVKTPLTIKVGANASYTYAPNTKSGALSTTEAPVLTYDGANNLTPETETGTAENIGVSTLDKLKAALSAGQKEIALNNNITVTGTSDVDIITISSDVVLYGNGHTLTSSAPRAINVDGNNNKALNVTIKNLTINTSGERGINIINGTGHSVNIENVTATAANYTVNVTSSAPNVSLTILDSELNGKNVVNIWGRNSAIDIINSIVHSSGSNNTETYSAIMLEQDDETGAYGTIVNVEGGSIIAEYVDGNPSHAVYNKILGTVTISETTDVKGDFVNASVIIDYGTEYFYSIEKLQDAINKVAADDKGIIKLLANINLTEQLIIPANESITIDLNGKTLSLEQPISVSGTLNLSNGTISSEGEVIVLENDGQVNIDENVKLKSGNGKGRIKNQDGLGTISASNLGNFIVYHEIEGGDFKSFMSLNVSLGNDKYAYENINTLVLKGIFKVNNADINEVNCSSNGISNPSDYFSSTGSQFGAHVKRIEFTEDSSLDVTKNVGDNTGRTSIGFEDICILGNASIIGNEVDESVIYFDRGTKITISEGKTLSLNNKLRLATGINPADSGKGNALVTGHGTLKIVGDNVDINDNIILDVKKIQVK